MADRVTLATDLISEMQVGHSKLVLPAPVQYDYPFKRTIVPTSIPDMADDIVNGSFGFKFAFRTDSPRSPTRSFRSIAVACARTSPTRPDSSSRSRSVDQ